MSEIRRLPREIAEKIAAGEVVSGPVSVVKELTENAIDAGARLIVVEVRDGGRSFLRVADDGSGIPADEAELAFAPHATSKLRDEADLLRIGTLGFRGEALASISAVSRMEMITKTGAAQMGVSLICSGGEILERKATGAADGTTVIVRDLFYNTPARLKFLKSERSETTKIIDFVSRVAVAYPGIRFRLITGAGVLFSTNGRGDVLQTIRTVYGDTGRELISVASEGPEGSGLSLRALISGPGQSRNNRRSQVFFVNGRAVADEAIGKAVASAYRQFLFEGRFPIVFLFLTVDPAAVDVNVHPAKSEIRFHDKGMVTRFIEEALRSSLASGAGIPAMLPARERGRLAREERKFFSLRKQARAEDGWEDGPPPPAGEGNRSSVPAGEGNRSPADAGGDGNRFSADCGGEGRPAAAGSHDFQPHAADYYAETVSIENLWSDADARQQEAGLINRVAEPSWAENEYISQSETKNSDANASYQGAFEKRFPHMRGQQGGDRNLQDQADCDMQSKVLPPDAAGADRDMASQVLPPATPQGVAGPGQDMSPQGAAEADRDMASQVLPPATPQGVAGQGQDMSPQGAAEADRDMLSQVQPQGSSQETVPAPAAAEHGAPARGPYGQMSMDIENLEIIGTVFAAYILATDGDSFYILDQHAAHERVNYERFLRQRQESLPMRQQLLTPQVMTVAAVQRLLLPHWMPILQEVGFDAEVFGKDAIVVKAFPAFLDYQEAEAFLRDILSGDEKPPENDAAMERLIMRACKQSIKAGQKLGPEQIGPLLKDLSGCDNPFSCPHGRPVFLKLTRYDLEKLFKRV